MTTGYRDLAIPGGIHADGSAGNLSAFLRNVVSSGTPPTGAAKIQHRVLVFVNTADTFWQWQFMLPADYASGGTLRGKLATSGTSSNAVTMKAGTAILTDSTTDYDSVVSDTVATASVTPSTTTEHVVEFTITLTMTNAAANKQATVWLGRDSTDASTVEAWVTSLRFEYTTT